MPEGDTIFRAARTLDAALAGKDVTNFSSPLPAVAGAARRLGIVGRAIEAVEPRGKHLLVRFAGGSVLHTHMRMTGSWHLYSPGTPWRGSRARARVVVETAAVHAVCFGAPVVELLSANQAARQPALLSLGEDLLSSGFDPERARAGLRRLAEVEIGVALLDQTAVAGIGNVYKSEVLFLCGVSPFVPVKALADGQLDLLVATARTQMKRNLGSGTRRTTSTLAREGLWVYERSGRPCRRCGTSIGRRRQGEQARSTWFCPGCQSVRAEARSR